MMGDFASQKMYSSRGDRLKAAANCKKFTAVVRLKRGKNKKAMGDSHSDRSLFSSGNNDDQTRQISNSDGGGGGWEPETDLAEGEDADPVSTRTRRLQRDLKRLFLSCDVDEAKGEAERLLKELDKVVREGETFGKRRNHRKNEGRNRERKSWNKAQLALTSAQILGGGIGRKLWVPPNWDAIMSKMRSEGRDIPSIDRDLRDIWHSRGGGGNAVPGGSCNSGGGGRTKTGKYLMPEDISWCRNFSRFQEKELFSLLKRFRKACPNGEMGKKELAEMFENCFPLANGNKVSGIAFEIMDVTRTSKLDYKDFVIVIDAVNHTLLSSKLRWASNLVTKHRGSVGVSVVAVREMISLKQVRKALSLVDQIEHGGFFEGATEDEIDALKYRCRQMDDLLPLSIRSEDLWKTVARTEFVEENDEIEVDKFVRASEKLVFARV